MNLHITTERHANRGADSWDGTGDCPQNWYVQGSRHFIITDVPDDADVNKLLHKAAAHFGYEQSTELVHEFLKSYDISHDQIASFQDVVTNPTASI